MNPKEYEQAMAEAQGDADAMLGATVLRVRELEELVDWAETLLCNSLPDGEYTMDDWLTIIKEWRDQKHGVQT